MKRTRRAGNAVNIIVRKKLILSLDGFSVWRLFQALRVSRFSWIVFGLSSGGLVVGVDIV